MDMSIPSAARELAEEAATGFSTPRERPIFPWWHALLVEPNREERSAQWLARVHVHVYLPTYSKKICRRGRTSTRRQCAAIPGMLFVPQEMMPDARAVFDYAHVHGYIHTADGWPTRISKSDIELVRTLEARLNLPPEAKGVLLKVGQHIRFKEESLWISWGEGTIFEIASEAKIGVEIPGLFGRATRVYVPEAEIEAMQPAPVGPQGRIPRSKRPTARQ